MQQQYNIYKLLNLPPVILFNINRLSEYSAKNIYCEHGYSMRVTRKYQGSFLEPATINNSTSGYLSCITT